MTERPAVGAPDVEIIELTKVPRRRQGRSNMAAVIAILSSLTALAAVAFVQRTERPQASIEPAVSGAASGVAVASTRPSPRSTSPLPTQRPATPRPPTTPPRTPAPGEWVSSEVAPGELMFPQGLWAFDGHFLVLSLAGQTDFGEQVWRFHTSIDGQQWVAQDAPPVVEAFAGGVVVDGRAWFAARLPGLSDADTRWELVSTLDGGSFEVVGQMEGWGISHGIGLLDRIGATWVATRYLDGTDETSTELLWSGDGLHWTVASIPVDPGELGPDGGWLAVGRTARIGDTMLMLGWLGNYEQSIQFVLASRDGRTWTRSQLPNRTGLSISGIACSADRCVMPAYVAGDTEQIERSVFVSTDGRTWRESALDIPVAADSGVFTQIIATPTGFLATGITPGAVWISSDGGHWRAVQVLPPGELNWLDSLVLNGDAAGGFGPSNGDASPLFWRGAIPTAT